MVDISKLKNDLEGVLSHLREEFAKVRTGRASVELVEGLKVQAYNSEMDLKAVASIGIADATTINIKPWDKTLAEEIAKALSSSELGLLVSIDGDMIRAKVPDLTEERRKEYVKIIGQMTEHARISVRQVRQKYMKEIESDVKDGLSEDEGKRLKDEVEKVVKEVNEKIDTLRENKEKDIMTI